MCEIRTYIKLVPFKVLGIQPVKSLFAMFLRNIEQGPTLVDVLEKKNSLTCSVVRLGYSQGLKRKTG